MTKMCKRDYNKILDAIEVIRELKLIGLILLYLEQYPKKHKIVKAGLDAMDKHNLSFLTIDKDVKK